jgi:hypothetical protein
VLALQIEAKEKAVKLMKKLAAQTDPARKAMLQQKLDKLLSQAAPVAAAAGATAASPIGVASSAAAGVRKQHRPQPLAGITSVLANTPAEQVRWQKQVVHNVFLRPCPMFAHLLLQSMQSCSCCTPVVALAGVVVNQRCSCSMMVEQRVNPQQRRT